MRTRKNKAVFLDRDGVINALVIRPDGKATSPWSADEFIFLPEVIEYVAKLRKVGFLIFVVTNQPGIQDGDMTVEQLNEINQLVKNELKTKHILAVTDKNSDYYKPNNSGIEFLIEKYNISRDNSYMVGDRWKDIVPATNSKLKTIFVGNDYSCPEEYKDIEPQYIVSNTAEACNIIMESQDAWV